MLYLNKSPYPLRTLRPANAWVYSLAGRAPAQPTGGHLPQQSIRIIPLPWACSSAGRAPALQVSSVNHLSAASGVVYAKTRGATNPLKWTDVGPKFFFSLGLHHIKVCNPSV